MKTEVMSNRSELIVNRIIIILIAGLVITGAVMEIAFALHAHWAVGHAGLALWAGAILWVIISGAGWTMRATWGSDEAPLWLLIPFSILPVLSVGAVFIPALRPFCAWSNAVLWTIMILSVYGILRDGWGFSSPAQKTDKPTGDEGKEQIDVVDPLRRSLGTLCNILGFSRLRYLPRRFFHRKSVLTHNFSWLH